MGTIQRAPQGFLELLSAKGVENLPKDLSQTLIPVTDMVQFYGLQQRVLLFRNDPALAEAGFLTAVPAAQLAFRQMPAVLFGASMGGIKTATMTAFRCSVEMSRGGDANSLSLASGELGPFGATETGAAGISFFAPYPILLTPPWDVFGRLQILGTDATANCTCIAEIGLLG